MKSSCRKNRTWKLKKRRIEIISFYFLRSPNMGIGGGRRVIFGKMVVIKNSFLFPPLLYTTISPYLGQECNRRRKKKEYIFTFRSGNSAYGHYCLGIKYRWKKRGGWDHFFWVWGGGRKHFPLPNGRMITGISRRKIPRRVAMGKEKWLLKSDHQP